jgi:hypothetical protein
MKKNLKHVLSLLCVLAFVFAGIESAPSKPITMESQQVPPDYKGYTQTLVIVRSSKDWNKYAEKYFSEYYSGNYVFVDSKEMGSYSDADKYRFVVTRNESTFYDPGAHSNYYDEKICMFDKKTKKSYCTKAKTGQYGKLLKEYAQALQNAR